MVGDDYILHADSKGHEVHRWSVGAKSWGFDPQGCRLWVQDGESVALFFPTGTRHSVPLNVTLVSDQIANAIFLLDGTTLIRADANGVLQERSTDPAFAQLKRVVPAACGFWGVQREGRGSLTMLEISHSLKLAQKTELAKGHELWAREKLLPGLDGMVWLGYSITTPSAIYSPRVDLIRPGGDIVATSAFQGKGLFFDACVAPDDRLVVSRDLAGSSEFTVPISSFVDAIDREGRTETLFAADTNQLIDAVACSTQSVFLAQHSILGGGNTRLSRIDFAHPKTETFLTSLPGTVRALYLCEGGP